MTVIHGADCVEIGTGEPMIFAAPTFNRTLMKNERSMVVSELIALLKASDH
jgi:hypothetical protein